MEKVSEAEVVSVKEKSDGDNVNSDNKYEEVNVDRKFNFSAFFNGNWKYLVVFICGIVLTIFTFSCFGGFSDKTAKTLIEVNDNGISAGINKVYDSTVYIENYKDKKVSVSGTGFIYKKDSGKAYILTNYHVVGSSSSLKVILSDDNSVDARFVGGDEYLDIAVISISDKYVKNVVKLGSSNKAVLGDTVFTVGSPVGDEYRGTVTRGILSGKDRLVAVSVSGGTDDYVMKLLQTDAAMNPGNSGGPLCNINGEVIGMNSLKLVKNEVEGMGFAIPIEDILAHLDTFEKGDSIKRPYLGISMVNLNNKDAVSYYGLSKKINTKLDKGVVVESVQKGTSADGKLEVGDIVTKVNRKEVVNMAYFRYELFKHEVGDKVTLTVERNGRLMDIIIALREK